MNISYVDLMHFCVSYASGYFSKDAYHMTFMFAMILCKPFSSLVSGSPLASSSPSRTKGYASPLGGPMYTCMGRGSESTTHATLPGLESFLRPCYDAFERICPTILHVFVFSNFNRGVTY